VNNQLLYECSTKKRSAKATYKELFEPMKPTPVVKQKRAHFVKLRLTIPDEPKVSRWINFLFFLPISILFIRICLSFVKLEKYAGESIPISKQDMIRLLSVKGSAVHVKSNDGVIVDIKTI
jgi:hypothetical protein